MKYVNTDIARYSYTHSNKAREKTLTMIELETLTKLETLTRL